MSIKMPKPPLKMCLGVLVDADGRLLSDVDMVAVNHAVRSCRRERPQQRRALLEAIDEIEAGMGGPRDATEDEVALLGRLCEAHGPEEYRRFAKIWLRRGER